MKLDREYYDLDALCATTNPLHQVRYDIISKILEGSISGDLEPMTLCFMKYNGAGNIRYSFPNSGRRLSQEFSDGSVSSMHPARTWRFMLDVMPYMELISRKASSLTFHFMCARFQPGLNERKNLFPMLLVSTCPPEMSPSEFSKINADIHAATTRKNHLYPVECMHQNKHFVSLMST